MRLDENIKSMYTIINNIHLSKCDKTHQHNKAQFLTLSIDGKTCFYIQIYVDKQL